MKKHLSFRILALVLSLVFLVTALPLGIFANDEPGESNNESASLNEEAPSYRLEGVSFLPNDSESDADFPREITELREESVKHFDNGDGTYEAISYGFPVHRKNADGAWHDIDNSLTLREEKGAERYITSDARISFAPLTSQNGTLWTLSENGYGISLSLSGADLRSGASADVRNHLSREDQILAAKSADDRDAAVRVDNRSTVLYRNVFTDVDLEYTLIGNDVKETILVNDARENYEFSFRLSLFGLIPEMTDNGTILLLDAENGDAVYHIPAPYMTDAADAYSNEVRFLLSDLGDGEYSLIVSASDEWINDPERAFPVAIDPSVSDRSGTCDTYFGCDSDAHKSTIFGGSSVMYLSNMQTPFIKSTSMPVLPNGATVTNARLFVAYYYGSGVTNSTLVSAHRATRDWNENSDTWNSMSQYGADPSLGLVSTSLSETYLSTGSDYPKWADIDVTDAVQYWYNGTRYANNYNYGIGLKRVSGNFYVIFHTRNANNGCTPYFVVCYRPTNGIFALLNYDAGCFLKGTTPLLSGQDTCGPSDRSSFFKFAYRPNTDDYVIRSMVDNSLTVYHNTPMHRPLSESVTNNDVQVPDENLDVSFTWKIGVHPDYPDGSRFMIWNECAGQNYYLAAEATWYGYSIILTTSVTDPGTSWDFLEMSEYSGQGVEPDTSVPQQIGYGETVDFDFHMFDYRIGINGPVYYSVTDTDGTMTNRATINSQTGLLTAQQYGRIQLRVSYSGAPTTWIWEISIGGTFVGEVPTTLRSNNSHLCIPCAITNIASFWCVSEGLTQFYCETSQQLEARATEVHAAMALAGSATSNTYIQDGYDIFSHTENGQTYTLNSLNCWASQNAFDWNSIVSEINAGRPVMLGFANVQGSPYGAHMTVCVGYTVSGGTRYVFLSDAHQSGYVQKPFSEAYNDFIAKVNLVSN